jgi:peptide chain release factor subunit 1
VAELAKQQFITDDKCNVAGLVLAGSAEFKQKLNESDLFDLRLNAAVVKIVDVSYGGENGFAQAIELSADALINVGVVKEQKLLSAFYLEVGDATALVTFISVLF